MYARIRACEGFLKRNLHLHSGRRKALSTGHSGGRGGLSSFTLPSLFLHITFSVCRFWGSTKTHLPAGAAAPLPCRGGVRGGVGNLTSGAAATRTSLRSDTLHLWVKEGGCVSPGFWICDPTPAPPLQGRGAAAQSGSFVRETLTVFPKTLTVFWKTLTVFWKTLTVFRQNAHRYRTATAHSGALTPRARASTHRTWTRTHCTTALARRTRDADACARGAQSRACGGEGW